MGDTCASGASIASKRGCLHRCIIIVVVGGDLTENEFVIQFADTVARCIGAATCVGIRDRTDGTKGATLRIGQVKGGA